MELEDLAGGKYEGEVLKAFKACTAIITSHASEQQFIQKLHQIIEADGNLNKNEKPIFVIDLEDLKCINERDSDKQHYGNFTSLQDQRNEILSSDLLEFGGFSQEKLTEYHTGDIQQKKQISDLDFILSL